jgi:hypothetical protein
MDISEKFCNEHGTININEMKDKQIKTEFITDGKNIINDINSNIYYHGSPSTIEILRKGSSITRNKKLAMAFSHKPSVLSISDDGEIKHNGTKKGYLYKIVEELKQNDIIVHPSCKSNDTWEFITQRDLEIIEIE